MLKGASCGILNMVNGGEHVAAESRGGSDFASQPRLRHRASQSNRGSNTEREYAHFLLQARANRLKRQDPSLCSPFTSHYGTHTGCLFRLPLPALDAGTTSSRYDTSNRGPRTYMYIFAYTKRPRSSRLTLALSPVCLLKLSSFESSGSGSFSSFFDSGCPLPFPSLPDLSYPLRVPFARASR